MLDRRHERDRVRAALHANLPRILQILFPNGVARSGHFRIGNVAGVPGESLEVELTGDKVGQWIDRATGQCGDVFTLIAEHKGWDVERDFQKVLAYARDLTGTTADPPPRRVHHEQLGPVTARWVYRDRDGTPLVRVDRFDPPGRRKEFRPFDLVRQVPGAPSPRPLYNLPGISAADNVVLVEGEKCAQALVDIGICATTAMHGANTSVEKTDWSPLAGKDVVIWPDNDEPGMAFANKALRAITLAGAARCTVMALPAGVAKGWDAADAVAEDRDVASLLRATSSLPREDDDNPADLPALAIFSDDELANAFTATTSHRWRFCPAHESWYFWDGQRWQEDKLNHLHHRVRLTCLAAASQASDAPLRRRLGSAGTVRAVSELARSDPRHTILAEAWDNDPWLLNAPEGLIDLRRGAYVNRTSERLVTKLTGASLGSPSPRWRAFIRTVTRDDEDLANYLARLAGYWATGLVSEQMLAFLYGTGANGKSVFLSALSAVFGDYAMDAPMSLLVESKHPQHPTDLAGLQGARFVTAHETEHSARWAEARLKQLTGGDHVTARFLYGNFFTFKPTHKLAVVGNHMPTLSNVGEAMARRLQIIPFGAYIAPNDRDPALLDKLLEERDGILLWIVEGCLAWQRTGLGRPAAVEQASHEYLEQEDTLGQWLHERCEQSPSAQTPIGALFADWQAWCRTNGEPERSTNWFSRSLCARGFSKGRDGRGKRCAVGIQLQSARRAA